MPFDELIRQIQKIADAEGDPTFMGRPDRWYEQPHWRCSNDHVSTGYLKSEALGYNACLACRGRIILTFPEDQDGPLVPV